MKLHLGCGGVYKEGWVNIDNNSDNNIARLDLNWDLRYPLPFSNNSVDFIYHEHLLEHLTIEEAHRFLLECKRVLKPSGIMRIAVPDLEFVIETYNNSNWEKDYKEFRKKYSLDFVKTKAEMININFRYWGHKWLYDWEELNRRLSDIPFAKIQKCVWNKSQYKELCSLESRTESVLIAEVSK